MSAAPYSAATVRALEDRFRAEGTLRPLKVRRYEAGQVLEYDVRGVWPDRPARVRLEVERHVGGGFAGQVYRVRVLDVAAPEGSIEGLEAGRACALKVLVPVSGFGRFVRNTLYGLGFQAPFAPQADPEAARAGALWQKFIRRAAAARFGTDRAVVDVLATLVDPELGSCGELSEWVDGRLWRYEIDDDLFARLAWKPGRPGDGLGSPEYRSKRVFMRELVALMHEMGASELARQYEWGTLKSQPNALKRLEADDDPERGLVAVDFRAGMALLPFLPQCPADFRLIARGVARGSLVQFDRGDVDALAAYVAARHGEFAGLEGALEALRSADGAYRDSLIDITHHHIRLLTRPRLWTAIHRAWVRGWGIRGLADAKAAGTLGRSGLASALFVLLGLAPILTPLLFLFRFPGRSAALWALWLLPLLGPFVRRLWGRADVRRHAAALVAKAGYLGRAFRAHVAERLVGWVRSGRVSEPRALAIAGKPGLYVVHRPLAFLPAGVHRFLTDKAVFKERLYLMFVKPVQLYFKPAVREKWLRDMVEEGRRNRMLSDADAAVIQAQIDEPFIQKYLKSLAVHMATLFVSETVFLTVAAVYVLGHPEFGWAEATARAALIVAAFNLLPVSPGSLIRGFYTLGLCVKERNFKDYRLALPVGFFKIIGYLAFPLQMAYRFPELARFMAGHWATEGVHVVPVFGERGAWLEHAVFDACYNFPLSLGIRIRKRDELAAARRPRRWAVPAAALAGGAFTALVELIFVRTSGHAAALKNVWGAVFLAPLGAGFLASLWSRRKKMGRRIAAGITAGALTGLAYGLVNAFLAPSMPGYAVLATAADASPWLPILWKTFVFALLGIPGAFLAELRDPGRPVTTAADRITDPS
ncbi:MAG: hypothetical protein KA243_07530 [Candidatus Aminicenantes bacterium]|nr:hypothetical protein [Candidatus Aminicenantes bacterium]